MSSSVISRRYAEALWMIGMERNALDRYVKDLEILEKHLKQGKNLIEAEVRSVIPLTAKDRQKLELKLTKLTGKKVRVKNTIDSALIGGLVITIGDSVLDGSVARKISLLKNWIVQDDPGPAVGFNKTFGKEPDVKKLLDDPGVLPKEKRKVLSDIIRGGISPVVAKFLYLILDQKREYLFSDIIREFRNYVDEAKNIIYAQVYSAVELSTREILELENRLSKKTGKNVRVKVQLDSTLIGGIMIKIGDTLIDGSVKKKLLLLKKGLSTGSLR